MGNFNNYEVKNVDKKHNGKLPNPKESCLAFNYLGLLWYIYVLSFVN